MGDLTREQVHQIVLGLAGVRNVDVADEMTDQLMALLAEHTQAPVLTGLEEEIARSAAVRITEVDLGDSDRARMTGLLMILDRLCPLGASEDTEGDRDG